MNDNERKIRQYAETLNKIAFKLVSLLNDIDIEVQERRSKIIVMSPRRKKPREGSIIHRKDGRFEGRYMDGGKQRSVYSKNYDDCLDKLERAVKCRDERVKSYTLLSWLSDFVTTYKQGRVKDKTYRQMIRNIELHIAPNISKDKSLSEYRPIDLQKILQAVSSDRVREDIHNILSGAFRQAVVERIIAYNPMLGVSSCKAKRNVGEPLTLEEQASFIERIKGHKLELYYLFCLYSGGRRSEVLSLRREDIDERAGNIHLPGTKTELSERYIPLFDAIKNLLDRVPASGDLFDFNSDYVSRQFKKFCPGHVLNDLRHTFATRALEAGVSLKVVSTWLGHSDIKTTANIYMKVLRRLHLVEAEKLDRMFDNSSHDDE